MWLLYKYSDYMYIIKSKTTIMKGVISMDYKFDANNLMTDVYMKTEHQKKKPKAKVTFEVVINKVIVGALLLTSIVGSTTPAYAATTDAIKDSTAKINLSSTISQNYEISVENAIHNVRETISAIQEMKGRGVVNDSMLQQLANQIMELDRAVNLTGKEVTSEVVSTVLDAENVVSTIQTTSKSAGVAQAAIAVVKQSLGIKTVAQTETISNKEAVQTVTSFSDVNSTHWAYKDIMTLVGKGIISGISTPVNGVGEYAPNDTVSLGEFLAISTRLVAEDSIKEIPNAGHWAAQNYAAAVESGLINSRDFKSTVEALNAGISREDMAYILVSVAKANGETLQIKDGIKNNINDYSSISSNRRSSVEAAYSNGLLVGGSDGKFNPKSTLTRAEVAAVFCRVMNYTTRPTVEVKTPEVGVRQPMTLRYDDPYRPKAIEGDTFITADGREVVLKVDPQTGILGFGQNVATELGRIGGTKGEPIVHGCLGGDSVNDEFLGQPYWIDSRTGMGLYRQQWLDVKRKIDPYKEVKNPTEGQLYKDYFKYRDGVWSWIGPVK